MIKKIIEISGGQTYLSIDKDQLVIKREDNVVSVPCEDVGVLLVDSPQVVYSHSVFTRLLRYGAAVVLCNGTHHPCGMLLPIESNDTQAESFAWQVNASQPLKKRLWQQLIQAKILHQAAVISDNAVISDKLKTLSSRVRSGDPDNLEGYASREYWKVFIDEDFCRAQDGDAPNNLLNYGYIVMRSAVARALCSSGLLPTLGIHHHNRYNAYCLADDVIEPFRGFVDAKVRQMWQRQPDKTTFATLAKEHKAGLLEILHSEVEIGGFKGPLMVGLHRTTASLKRCFEGSQDKIDLPEI